MREKKELNVQIGDRIKRARERAKITQESMAEQIEVSPQYVSDLERGVVGISVPTLRRVCTVLCVPSDELLFDAARLPQPGSTSSGVCLNSRQTQLLDEIVRCFLAAVASD